MSHSPLRRVAAILAGSALAVVMVELDAVAGPGDLDNDTIPDAVDNCPDIPNFDQLDRENDGAGDDCDVCPDLVDPRQDDFDGDGIGDYCDVCVDLVANPDIDLDGVCDPGDVCLGANETGDSDGDGTCDDRDFALDAGEVLLNATGTFTVHNASPGSHVAILASTRGVGRRICAPGGFPCTVLLQPTVLPSAGRAGLDGEFSLTVRIPWGLRAFPTTWFQAVWYDPATGTWDATEVDERPTRFP